MMSLWWQCLLILAVIFEYSNGAIVKELQTKDLIDIDNKLLSDQKIIRSARQSSVYHLQNKKNANGQAAKNNKIEDDKNVDNQVEPNSPAIDAKKPNKDNKISSEEVVSSESDEDLDRNATKIGLENNNPNNKEHDRLSLSRSGTLGDSDEDPTNKQAWPNKSAKPNNLGFAPSRVPPKNPSYPLNYFPPSQTQTQSQTQSQTFNNAKRPNSHLTPEIYIHQQYNPSNNPSALDYKQQQQPNFNIGSYPPAQQQQPNFNIGSYPPAQQQQPNFNIGSYPPAQQQQPNFNIGSYPPAQQQQPNFNIGSYLPAQQQQQNFNIGSYPPAQQQQPNFNIGSYSPALDYNQQQQPNFNIESYPSAQQQQPNFNIGIYPPAQQQQPNFNMGTYSPALDYNKQQQPNFNIGSYAPAQQQQSNFNIGTYPPAFDYYQQQQQQQQPNFNMGPYPASNYQQQQSNFYKPILSRTQCSQHFFQNYFSPFSYRSTLDYSYIFHQEDRPLNYPYYQNGPNCNPLCPSY